MYISPRLRGGNRFSGGFLETFEAIWLASKRNGRVEVLFWILSNNFSPCIFLSGAWGEPVYRRVSSHLFSDFGSPLSGTEGWRFCLGVFPTIYTMYIFSRLRGGNRFAGGSLETFAAILVRLQAEREGGEFVLASFNKFTPRIFLPGCAGGTGWLATL